jgi:hypothetical protein
VLGKFFGTVVSFILGELPIIGTILAIRGAMINWDWHIFQALGLFVGVPILIIIITGLRNKYEP